MSHYVNVDWVAECAEIDEGFAVVWVRGVNRDGAAAKRFLQDEQGVGVAGKGRFDKRGVRSADCGDEDFALGHVAIEKSFGGVGGWEIFYGLLIGNGILYGCD